MLALKTIEYSMCCYYDWALTACINGENFLKGTSLLLQD